MKALTIREPFASLIKEGYKKYETRSFKTNYRGELYIHAGKAKVKEKQFENRPHLKELSNNCSVAIDPGFSNNKNDIYYMILDTVKDRYPYC